jgi:hypothetical protein
MTIPFLTEQDILGIGSKLNSAYLFRKQTKGTKLLLSAPNYFNSAQVQNRDL